MQNNTCINDIQWSEMLAFLQKKSGVYARNTIILRQFLDGVFWIMRTGAQWRELPDKYGKWNSVFCRFNCWSKKNIWYEMFEEFSSDPDMQSVMLDSTIVRAHACAAGYAKDSGEKEALGRSCGGFASKLHAIVDALGNPIKFILSEGNSHDVNYAKSLIDGINNCPVLADKGYDSNDFLLKILEQDCVPVIPPRKNRAFQREYDKDGYKERHLVECFFGKIKHFRRIFARFDKSLSNYVSFLYFAATHVWLR